MKSIFAVSLTLIIGITLAVYYCIRHRDPKEISSRYGVVALFIFGFGFLAAIVNNASVPVYTITECQKTGYTKTSYFLYYTAHFHNNETQKVFLRPNAVGCIQNNTNVDLCLYSVVYGQSESYDAKVIRPNTLITVDFKPRFFFEPVPSRILYSSRRHHSSGKTFGVVLRRGEKIQYKEVKYP